MPSRQNAPRPRVQIGPTAAAAGGDRLRQAAELIAEAFCFDAGPYVDGDVPETYLGYVQGCIEQEFQDGIDSLALVPLDDPRWKMAPPKREAVR